MRVGWGRDGDKAQGFLGLGGGRKEAERGRWKDMKLNFLLKRPLTKQDKTEC